MRITIQGVWQWQILYSQAPESLWLLTAAVKLRYLLLGKKAMTILESILKSRGISLLTKVHLVKAMVFTVVMHGCESWTTKKSECQRIDVLNCGAGENSWKSLGQKEIKPVHPKGNQPRIFIGRSDAEAEGQYFDYLMRRADPLEKTLTQGKDWRQEEKGATEDEMLDGITDSMDMHLSKLQETVRDKEAGKLACCSPWRLRESDRT